MLIQRRIAALVLCTTLLGLGYVAVTLLPAKAALPSHNPQSPHDAIGVAQATPPAITLIVPTALQPPDASIDVEVRISGASNLGAFEFDLDYDRTLVQVTGMTLND